MCDEGKEKRERSLDVSLLFFFRENISVRFRWVSANEKAAIFKSNDFGIVLHIPEEEKKGNYDQHRKRIEQERDR
tara:strand:- start:58 stop:282 length:225 start_codon:yes stop_codon:yes gene_type:complete